MPWTFAHPAAVLPLRRLFRSRPLFCALVVGSMSPDFGFFLGSYVISSKAHTMWGLLTICLPSGLAILAIIQVLHGPIIDLLPFPHRQRLHSLAPLRSLRSPWTLFWASIALLVGGLTHVIWDSFTHESGYFVLQWPILRDPVFFLGTKGFQLDEVLQDVSSVFGAAIVILAYRKWVRSRENSQNALARADDSWRYRLLAIIAIAALVIAAPLAYSVFIAVHGGTRHLVLLLVRLHIYSTTAFFTLLCVASIANAHRTNKCSKSLER